MSNRKHFLIGAVAFIAVMLVFGGVATYMLSEQNKIGYYVETQAVIVDHHSIWDSDEGAYTYNDIVRYEVDGKSYQALCNYDGYRYKPNNIGQTRTVYYNPDDPSDVIFATDSRIIILTFLYAIAGVFGIASVIFFAKAVKSKY